MYATHRFKFTPRENIAANVCYTHGRTHTHARAESPLQFLVLVCGRHAKRNTRGMFTRKNIKLLTHVPRASASLHLPLRLAMSFRSTRPGFSCWCGAALPQTTPMARATGLRARLMAKPRQPKKMRRIKNEPNVIFYPFALWMCTVSAYIPAPVVLTWVQHRHRCAPGEHRYVVAIHGCRGSVRLYALQRRALVSDARYVCTSFLVGK